MVGACIHKLLTLTFPVEISVSVQFVCLFCSVSCIIASQWLSLANTTVILSLASVESGY